MQLLNKATTLVRPNDFTLLLSGMKKPRAIGGQFLAWNKIHACRK